MIFTFALLFYIVLFLRHKMDRGSSEKLSDSVVQKDFGEDWDTEETDYGGGNNDWLHYFSSPDVFRQDHSVVEVYFQVRDNEIFTHRFTRENSSYLRNPARRINGKFEYWQNRNAWESEFFHHLSSRGLEEAKLFRAVLISLDFTEHNFLDLMLTKFDQEKLKYKWRDVKVGLVSPFFV